MSKYIDAIVIPVPRAKLDTYKRMSTEWGKAHLRHGALYYSDSISDDAQPGKVTSFPQAVQLKDGEVIALAWSMDPSKMPFDGKRMFWGGFETVIGLAAGQ
jgi:uncharacterized protein YbaA (DUF1428 family)